MATNDGMARKVGWWLVSQREKVFSCGTASGQWVVQVKIAEHVLSLWTRRRSDGDGDGGDDAGGDGGACGGQWVVVQVRIAEHVLSLWTRGVRMMVVNSKQPKIRYGRKAALRTSYGF